jgi:DNA-binding NarL/FixJ family response regulator
VGNGDLLSVLAAVDDLFFATRIRETARQFGVPVEIVPAAKFELALSGRADGDEVTSVIVDLNSTEAIELIRRLKTASRTRDVPILGFVSHVAADRIAEARSAGCDRVMARSAFTQQLPELLRQLHAGRSSAVPNAQDQG